MSEAGSLAAAESPVDSVAANRFAGSRRRRISTSTLAPAEDFPTPRRRKASLPAPQGGAGRSSTPAERTRPARTRPARTRSGFAALIGAPNSGKSTLANRLCGEKVSIVTHKVQTTRMSVRGVVRHGSAQIVLVDTPGIFSPRRRLDEAMVSNAWSVAADADAVVLLADARRRIDENLQRILSRLSTLSGKRPLALALNKIDVAPRESLPERAGQFNRSCPFERTFMISARTGDGCEDLLEWLASRMPDSPWLYGEDEVRDQPLALLASEITREKLYLRLHDEIPYQAHVETQSWQEKPDGSVRIEQTVFVERDSQRKIVIGEGGAAIKSVSMASRKELSKLLGCPVHLFLFVKVRSWGDDPERYKAMGLSFPRSARGKGDGMEG